MCNSLFPASPHSSATLSQVPAACVEGAAEGYARGIIPILSQLDVNTCETFRKIMLITPSG